MSIKTTFKFYPTTIRMVRINKTNDSSSWPECKVMGTFTHCEWGKCNLVQPVLTSVRWFLRKIGINLSKHLAKPLPRVGHIPKDASSYHSDTCSTFLIPALFIIDRNWREENILPCHCKNVVEIGTVSKWLI